MNRRLATTAKMVSRITSLPLGFAFLILVTESDHAQSDAIAAIKALMLMRAIGVQEKIHRETSNRVVGDHSGARFSIPWLMSSQASARIVRYARAQEVFGSDDLMTVVGKFCSAATLANIRNITMNSRKAVDGTTYLRNQVMVGFPSEFLSMDPTLPQAIRDANVQALKYSPYLKGLTTQSFLIIDKMSGWYKEAGSAMFNFLPAAQEAFNSYPDQLKKTQYAHPAIQRLELVFFCLTREQSKTSIKVNIYKPTGITLYHILNEWMKNTGKKVERGAPICVTPIGAQPETMQSTKSHEYTEKTFKRLRRCLADLGMLSKEKEQMNGREHFSGWQQNENVIKKWYKKTCIEGELWFSLERDKQEQAYFLKECEAEVRDFEMMKLTEKGDMDDAAWLKHCLEWKRGKTAANRVFQTKKLLSRMASYLEDTELPNLWRLNRKTAKLFAKDAGIRRRMLLKSANPLVAIHTATLSIDHKKHLKQKVVINNLFGRLTEADLISKVDRSINLDLVDDGAGIGGYHGLFHFNAKRILASHKSTKSYSHRSSAEEMYLTSPPLKDVHLHVASWSMLQNPNIKPCPVKVGYCGVNDYVHFDGILTVHVASKNGVTIGDVIRAFFANTRDVEDRAVPVCLSLFDAGEAGAKLLAIEVGMVAGDAVVSRRGRRTYTFT